MSWNNSKIILNVAEDHSFKLNEPELQKILLGEDVKDLPVVVVCVAGIDRIANSYLLDYLLKYFCSTPANQQDGSWMKGDFVNSLDVYMRNSDHNMRSSWGIRMWPKPFIIDLSSDKKVAVLLIEMDLPHLTASFCNALFRRQSSTIFALSTLLSSVQIFNISTNMKNGKQNATPKLLLFDHGIETMEHNMRAFRVLESLYKDWQFLFYPPLETAVARTLHDIMLQMKVSHENAKLQNDILCASDKVFCYPMPDFKQGKPELNADFNDWYTKKLDRLVKTLFGANNLRCYIKRVNKEEIKTKHIIMYLKSFVTLFNINKLPNNDEIIKASVEVHLQSAFEDACDMYDKGMDTECGRHALSVSDLDLKHLHQQYTEKTRAIFVNMKKIGSKEEIDKYLEKFTTELYKRLLQFAVVNITKIQHSINTARKSYKKRIQTVTEDHQLRVHILDLEDVHNSAVKDSLKKFEESRKVPRNKKDDERAQLLRSFEKQFELLKLRNEYNNMQFIYSLLMDYWKTMLAKSVFKPNDTEYFLQLHKNCMQKAINEFLIGRSIQNQYAEDVFVTKLVMMIEESLLQLEIIKKSDRSTDLQAAVEMYDEEMNTPKYKNQCLHPNMLERAHQIASSNALKVLRPSSKPYIHGFDNEDKDEIRLMEILRQRYKCLQVLNSLANRTNAEEAYISYMCLMEDFNRPSQYWANVNTIFYSLKDRSEKHKEFKTAAINLFNKKRNNGSGAYSLDTTKRILIQRIDDVYNYCYFWPRLSSLMSATLPTQIKIRLPQNGYPELKHN